MEPKEFYQNIRIDLPWFRPIRQRHFRAKRGDFWIKLNKMAPYGRIRNEEQLRKLLARLEPDSVYMSVLRWLFPERVGRKCKANYAVPLGGHFFLDVDAKLFFSRWGIRKLKEGEVRLGSLEYAKRRILHLADLVKEYYDDILVVFSGWKGFHLHVLDFTPEDWARRREKDPIRFQSAARYHFALELQVLGAFLDRHHFTLAVDPMRVFAVPWTLKKASNLAVIPIGSPSMLEYMTTYDIVFKAATVARKARIVAAELVI